MKNNIIRKYMMAASAALLPFGVSSPVAAENSVVVDIEAYDLQTTAGYEAVSARIEAAAERVCGSRSRIGRLARPTLGNCVRETLEDAMRELDMRTQRARQITSR